jgi:hypothetical protein
MQCFQKDPNLRVSAAKLLNHRWVKASAQRMQQKAADSAAAATPIVPALPSASSDTAAASPAPASSTAAAVVPTIEIEPPTPLSLEGKFAPPPSSRPHGKTTGSSGSVTSRLPSDTNGKKKSGARSLSDDDMVMADAELELEQLSKERGERIRFEAKSSGKHRTRAKEDRDSKDKDRKRDDKKSAGKDDKKYTSLHHCTTAYAHTHASHAAAANELGLDGVVLSQGHDQGGEGREKNVKEGQQVGHLPRSAPHPGGIAQALPQQLVVRLCRFLPPPPPLLIRSTSS